MSDASLMAHGLIQVIQSDLVVLGMAAPSCVNALLCSVSLRNLSPVEYPHTVGTCLNVQVGTCLNVQASLCLLV